MTIEEMQKELTQLHNEQFETKVLNIILNIYAEIKGHEKAIIELQQKINEIVKLINNAEPINTEEVPTNEESAAEE